MTSTPALVILRSGCITEWLVARGQSGRAKIWKHDGIRLERLERPLTVSSSAVVTTRWRLIVLQVHQVLMCHLYRST